jgi:hypothetical protein
MAIANISSRLKYFLFIDIAPFVFKGVDAIIPSKGLMPTKTVGYKQKMNMHQVVNLV